MRKAYHHFLDSGAHSLRNKHLLDEKTESFDFYRTQVFWDYVDSYAAFIKKYKRATDYYVNVDVIFNPKMSWEVLKYLENEHGLNPVPVIHYGEDLKWVEKHLEAGYKFLGIGGLGQEVSASIYTKWADKVYDIICNTPDGKPCVKTHGFAMTSYPLMTRYPWWSVDSASWVKIAAYGGIYVPKIYRGKFTFDDKPYVMAVSSESSALKDHSKPHFKKLTPRHRKIVEQWLEFIGVPLDGVTTHYAYRNKVNLLFFEMLRKSIPPWPWSYRHKKQMRLLDFEPVANSRRKRGPVLATPQPMNIFYSGGIDKNGPEEVIGTKANLMLTYYSSRKKPEKRFLRILDARTHKKPSKRSRPKKQ